MVNHIKELNSVQFMHVKKRGDLDFFLSNLNDGSKRNFILVVWSKAVSNLGIIKWLPFSHEYGFEVDNGRYNVVLQVKHMENIIYVMDMLNNGWLEKEINANRSN